MGKVLKFGNIEIEKQNYYQHKEPISIKIYIYIYVLIKQQYSIRSLLVKNDLII